MIRFNVCSISHARVTSFQCRTAPIDIVCFLRAAKKKRAQKLVKNFACCNRRHHRVLCVICGGHKYIVGFIPSLCARKWHRRWAQEENIIELTLLLSSLPPPTDHQTRLYEHISCTPDIRPDIKSADEKRSEMK